MNDRLIKRFSFAPSRLLLPAGELEARWLCALEQKTRLAPAGVQPLRAAVCCALQASAAEAPHAGVSIEWFPDLAALRRYQTWERQQLAATETAALAPGALLEVITEELVLRGSDWLAQRWRTGDIKFKHMALARRAPQLTAAEFSARWRSRPGQIGGGQTPMLAIPEAAKGQAYCQNHPLPESADPAYDAINEVYFDKLEDMRARLDFFRDQPVAQLDADLVSEPRFMVVRECLVACTTT